MKAKQKIAVLENVSDLDKPFMEYLGQLDADVDVVYSILNKSPEKQQEIHAALSKCEVLCVCSTFSNQDQLAHFVKLIPNYKNIKEVRIMYLYSEVGIGKSRELLHKLNLKIDRPVLSGIISLLNTVKVSEIFFLSMVEEKREYFDKLIYFFDVVELYYIKKKDLLWHKRVPYIVLPGDDNYLDRQPAKKEFTIDKKDLPELKKAMQEFRAVLDSQIESCEDRDFGHSEKLIAEKKAWLAILDKYKL